LPRKRGDRGERGPSKDLNTRADEKGPGIVQHRNEGAMFFAHAP
jgi:hypothetical protein